MEDSYLPSARWSKMTLLLSANVAHENYSLVFIGQVDSEKIGGLFSAGHDGYFRSAIFHVLRSGSSIPFSVIIGITDGTISPATTTDAGFVQDSYTSQSKHPAIFANRKGGKAQEWKGRY
jgi:hypothetical protein